MPSLRRIEDEQLNLDTWTELHSSAHSLTSLVIHGSHLNTFGSQKLPPFRALVDLNLSSNFLVDFCGNGFNSLNLLVKLDLSSNRLRGEVFTISGLRFPSLKQLLVPYNAITSLVGLPDVCPRLESLDARSNRLLGSDTLNVIRKLPAIQTVDLELKDLDHRTAFGMVDTLCNYDGHSIDDSDSEEMPMALKSILFHKSSVSKPSPNSTDHQAPSSRPEPVIIAPHLSSNPPSAASPSLQASPSDAMSTPRFDQLAQQRRNAEEEKIREKEHKADQRIRELESRLDALSSAAGSRYPSQRKSEVVDRGSFSDGTGEMHGRSNGQRRNFLKQPLFIPGPESPDRGPITREDDEMGHGFSTQPSSSPYSTNDGRRVYNDDDDDDFPPTYPSSRRHHQLEDSYSDSMDATSWMHDDVDVSTDFKGSGKIRSDRLQRLRHTGPTNTSPQAQSRKEMSEQHEVLNGSVKLVSRSKHSKTVAWDRHPSSKSPHSNMPHRYEASKRRTSPLHRQSKHKEEVEQHHQHAHQHHRKATHQGQGAESGDAEVDPVSQDNSNANGTKQTTLPTTPLPSNTSGDDDDSLTVQNCLLRSLGGYLGRKIKFTKITAFHRWHVNIRRLCSEEDISKLLDQSKQDLLKLKQECEENVNRIQQEKQSLMEDFEVKEETMKVQIEQVQTQLEDQNIKLLKCEKALNHANSQVLQAEDGVARLVQAESRVAVLKARADIEASYAEQMITMRSEHTTKELELRKQLCAVEEALSCAQEKESSLESKLKSCSDVAEQSELKLARAMKEFSEKERSYVNELEMSSKKAEEAMRTLQNRANSKVSELQRAFTEVAHGAAESKQRAATAVSREKQLAETVSELSALARDQRDSLKSLRKKLAAYESKSAQKHSDEDKMTVREARGVVSNREQELEKEYKQMIHSLEIRVAEAENSIMSSVEGMKQAQAESQEWEDKYNNVFNELQKNTATYEVQHVLLADSQNLCEELKIRNETLEDKISELKSTMNENNQLFEDEKLELESEIQSSKNEIDALNNRIEDQEEIETHLRDIVKELRRQASKEEGSRSGHVSKLKVEDGHHSPKVRAKAELHSDYDKRANDDDDRSEGNIREDRGRDDDQRRSSVEAALRELVSEKDKALQFIEGELLGMKEVFETREHQLLASINQEKLKLEKITNECQVKQTALISKYQTLENEKFKLDEDYHTARKRINELTNQIDELELELTQCKRKASHAESEAIRFQGALHAVNNALYGNSGMQGGDGYHVGSHHHTAQMGIPPTSFHQNHTPQAFGSRDSGGGGGGDRSEQYRATQAPSAQLPRSPPRIQRYSPTKP